MKSQCPLCRGRKRLSIRGRNSDGIKCPVCHGDKFWTKDNCFEMRMLRLGHEHNIKFNKSYSYRYGRMLSNYVAAVKRDDPSDNFTMWDKCGMLVQSKLRNIAKQTRG